MAKKALGRGLNAIFEDVEESYNKELKNSDKNEIIQEIEVDIIKPNPYQPRVHFDENALNELSKSIEKHGLLQPIIVYKKDNDFVLLAGERRLRASKIAGLEKIKAIVADIKSHNLRELALIENIQREDLNPIELAISYNELIEEYKVTQEELSNIIHKSRAQITNTLRLLNLTKKTQDLIIQGKLSQGHAKVIVGLDKDQENMVVDTVLGQKLSVRETEKLVVNLKNDKKSKKQPKEFLQNMQDIKNVLKDMDFKIKNNNLTIKFRSEDEIVNFIKKLS